LAFKIAVPENAGCFNQT